MSGRSNWIFQRSCGTYFAFGFDMNGKGRDPHKICWSEPYHGRPGDKIGGVWPEMSFNMLPFEVAPEFIRECDGIIVAYQPGKCIEIYPDAFPVQWGFRILEAPQ